MAIFSFLLPTKQYHCNAYNVICTSREGSEGDQRERERAIESEKFFDN